MILYYWECINLDKSAVTQDFSGHGSVPPASHQLSWDVPHHRSLPPLSLAEAEPEKGGLILHGSQWLAGLRARPHGRVASSVSQCPR